MLPLLDCITYLNMLFFIVYYFMIPILFLHGNDTSHPGKLSIQRCVVIQKVFSISEAWN